MNVKKILTELEVIPKKSRGQNFLIDENIARKIVTFANVQDDDCVLEIGPGVGAISEFLISQARDYYCVEIENKFINFLKDNFPQIPSEHFINQDIRLVDIKSILRLNANIAKQSIAPAVSLNNFQKILIVSNLPYSISSEVFFWIIKNRCYIKSVSLLLQREFAERLAAKPNSKAYSSISVQRELYADALLGDVVSGNCFMPKAAVESRLLRLNILENPRFNVDVEKFEFVLRGAFSTRRKTILNALSSALQNNVEQTVTGMQKEVGSCRPDYKGKVLDILNAAKISPTARAEQLALADFCRLAGEFK